MQFAHEVEVQAMNKHTTEDKEKTYNVLVDHNGNKYICGQGVNDQGYLSAQHCWEVDDKEVIQRLIK